MNLKTTFLSAAATALVMGGTAAVAEPALIYDLGGKFDKSFNEAAFHGAEKWAKDTGGKYKDLEISSEAQREQALRQFAEKGFSPIITTGFSFATPIEKVAGDYPDVKFVTIDGYVDPDKNPNVLSVLFKEEEGSYLVGILAAMKAEADGSKTVSFVGGMDIPLIRKFACGYAQGAKSVDPDIKVIANMIGTDPTAWNDQLKASELTKAQIAQGSDVIFAAAGASGLGVLQTAADEGKYGIGVDSNQNYLHPGHVLTSMLKRVDVVTEEAMKAGADLKTGVRMEGLKEDGVGYALDDNNKDLITADMKAAADKAKEGIIAGTIKVHDYSADNTCPALQF